MAQAVEPARSADMGAWWNHLHRRNVQGQGQADLRPWRFARGRVEALQLESRWRYAARNRLTGGGRSRRSGVQDTHPRSGGVERIAHEALGLLADCRRRRPRSIGIAIA